MVVDMPKQLTDMKIDEVSLVYKGANQHARVTIAKSADDEGEGTMEEYFDEDGNVVDVDSLEHGDVVYDENNEPFEYIVNDEDEAEEVGKASAPFSTEIARRAVPGRGVFQGAGGGRVKAGFGEAKFRAGQAKQKINAYRRGKLPNQISTAGAGARRVAGNRGVQIGAGTVGGGAVTYGGLEANRRRKQGEFGKSLAQGYREELSKALTDEDRDEVFSKAFEDIEALAEQAAYAEEIAKAEHDARVFNDYVEIAKSYALPVEDEELAGVMMRVAEALDEEDVEVIAKCFRVASDAMFEEYGNIGGGSNSAILDQVEQASISKSGEVDVDTYISLMEQNPALYDQYESEKTYR